MFSSPRKPSRTPPSQPANPDAKPSGKPTIAHSAVREEIEDIELENASAMVLAKNGYVVEQNPDETRLKALGYGYNADPDYVIENLVFDSYAPRTVTSLDTIFETLRFKSNKQTSRVVLNMRRNSGDLNTLRAWLLRYHQANLPNLEEVLVITSEGYIDHLFP